MTTAAILAAALAAFLPSSAVAEGQGRGGDDPVWKACEADAERLCAGIEKVHACVNEHWDQLSKKCRAAKEGANKAWAKGGYPDPMRKACGADVDAFCSNTPEPGLCLQQHWDELSPDCRAFKDKMKQQYRPDPMQEACRGDLERHCAGSAKPGLCLHEHWDELSPACRAFKEGARKKGEPQGGKRAKGEKAGKKGKLGFQWSDKKKQAEDEAAKP